jgi:hypothetical protein
MNLGNISILMFFILATHANAQQGNITLTNSVKFVIKKNWYDKAVALVVSDSAIKTNEESRITKTIAKCAIYSHAEPDKSPRSFNGETFEYYIGAIRNPVNNKIYLIDAGCDIYLADQTNLTGVYNPASGEMTCVRNILPPESGGNFDFAIKKFEKELDFEKLGPGQNISQQFRIRITAAAPPNFFLGPNSSGMIASASPKLQSAALTDGILQLDILGMNLTQSGSFFIDLNARKVVKSIINGQEMNLNAIINLPPHF